MLFTDRIDAARQLLPQLARFAADDVVLMAVPRGAVPMGRVIADHFHWPLSIVLIKKISHPNNPEYAIGAVGLDSMFIEPGHDDVSEDELNHAIEIAREKLQHQAEVFIGTSNQPAVRGRTVILIDDGIATGSTILAAVGLLRNLHPKRIVVTAPVASTSSVSLLRPLVDDLIVLETSSTFIAVGEYYKDFSQVNDDDVVRALRKEQI